MAIDPRSGASVFARFSMIPNNPTTKQLLPPRPPLRVLKCVWDGSGKSFRQVFARVRRVLEHLKYEYDGDPHTLYGLLDYFSPGDDPWRDNPAWQDLWQYKGARYRWIACFAVTGTSEGHYIHVDLIGTDGPLGRHD